MYIYTSCEFKILLGKSWKNSWKVLDFQNIEGVRTLNTATEYQFETVISKICEQRSTGFVRLEFQEIPGIVFYSWKLLEN